LIAADGSAEIVPRS